MIVEEQWSFTINYGVTAPTKPPSEVGIGGWLLAGVLAALVLREREKAGRR